MSYIIFKQLFTSAPADYVLQKLHGTAKLMREAEPGSLSLDELNKQVQRGPMQDDQLPKLASRDQFFELDERAHRIIELSKHCALADLHSSAPLIPGETIESDVFSYLSQAYEDVPEGTGALVRTTNYAITIHLFEGTLITDEGLVNNMVVDEIASLPSPRLTGGESLVAKILLKILSSAASSAGSKVGASIFKAVSEALFGPDSEDLAKTIANVMKKEITENTVTEFAGRLDGIISYLTIDYLNRKAKSDLSDMEDRKALYTILEQYSQSLYAVIGVLSQERFERVGLQSYMLATSMHILLYQEAAMVDYKTKNPNESDKFFTMQSRASIFRNHVDRVFHDIVTDRLAKITLERISTSVTVDMKRIDRKWVVYQDSEEGINMVYGDDKNGKNYEMLKVKYNAHVKVVTQSLKESYANPEKTYLPYVAKIASKDYRIKM
ncbi:hypothetical protein [Gilvimarinus polysaccharolyticus]|uniref:hypothetical protein n=1 Tax=Gilvimarinus polysaccharolyticus TaxID=863921 RepID=UPI000673753B|nr:hypothetical protein [Gilvimarinus polysaccharolyticus]